MNLKILHALTSIGYGIAWMEFTIACINENIIQASHKNACLFMISGLVVLVTITIIKRNCRVKIT